MVDNLPSVGNVLSTRTVFYHATWRSVHSIKIIATFIRRLPPAFQEQRVTEIVFDDSVTLYSSVVRPVEYRLVYRGTNTPITVQRQVTRQVTRNEERQVTVFELQDVEKQITRDVVVYDEETREVETGDFKTEIRYENREITETITEIEMRQVTRTRTITGTETKTESYPATIGRFDTTFRLQYQGTHEEIYRHRESAADCLHSYHATNAGG